MKNIKGFNKEKPMGNYYISENEDLKKYDFFETTKDLKFEDGTDIKKGTEFIIEKIDDKIGVHFPSDDNNRYNNELGEYEFTLEKIKDFAKPTEESIRENNFKNIKNRILDNLSKDVDEYEFEEKLSYINTKYGDIDKFTKEYIKVASSEAAKNHQIEHLEINPRAIENREMSVVDVNDFISSEREIDDYNKKIMKERLKELQDKHIKGDFNSKHLSKINNYLTNEMEGYGEFNVAAIDELNDTVFQDLKENKFLKGMDHAQVSEKLAEYFMKIDDTKPFMKGNIATAKVFIKELAAKNGFELGMDKLSSKAIGVSEVSKTIEKSFENIEPSKDLMKNMDFGMDFDR